MRSILQVMTFLSKGVCVPEEHVGSGVAPMTPGPDGLPFDWTRVTAGHLLRPLRASTARRDAEVTVHYRGYWFYIAGNDVNRVPCWRSSNSSSPSRSPKRSPRTAPDAAGRRLSEFLDHARLGWIRAPGLSIISNYGSRTPDYWPVTLHDLPDGRICVQSGGGPGERYEPSAHDPGDREGLARPSGYLSKVLQSMGRAGLVEARRGLRGGYVLTQPLDQLTVYDVVNAVDPSSGSSNVPSGSPPTPTGSARSTSGSMTRSRCWRPTSSRRPSRCSSKIEVAPLPGPLCELPRVLGHRP